MSNTYSAHIIGNRSGISDSSVNVLDTTNYKNVDLNGANLLVVTRDDNGVMTIVRASGWSFERGIFCDLYSAVTGMPIYKFCK